MNPIHILLGKLIYFFYNYSIKLVSKYQTHRLTRTEKIMGAGSRINGFGKLSGRDFFSSGKNVHIGNNFFIRAEGGLYIGDNTHISHNVSIYTINHNYKGKRLPYDEDLIKKAVKIEKNVWIGTKVIILPGTHIEEGAIVGAGAVVSGTIKKGEIIGASLANTISSRDPQHYNALEKGQVYGGVNGRELNNE